VVMLMSANLGPSVFLIFYYNFVKRGPLRLLHNFVHIVTQTTWINAANLATSRFLLFSWVHIWWLNCMSVH